MLDLPKFVTGLHDYISLALKPLVERLATLEQRQPERGEKGERGEAGERGPAGEKGVAGDPGTPGESIIGSQGDRGTPGEKGERGEKGESGNLGPAGEKGADAEVDWNLIREGITKAISDLPKPKDGEPGEDGKDGVSVTVDDIRPLFEKELAKWELDFERRSSDLIQRCIDRIEKPKDGAPGKDGRDALDLENFELSLSEDERTLTVALVRGETRVERSVQLHYPLYREIYKDGVHYLRGDTVTYGGSQWSAMRDTQSKPETDDSWRLSVKRGRDGKDGAPGPRGPEGRKGKDGGRLAAPY